MVNRANLVFAEHDGTKLVGDLYLPKGREQGTGPWSPFTVAAGKSAASNSIAIGACSLARADCSLFSRSITGWETRRLIPPPSTM